MSDFTKPLSPSLGGFQPQPEATDAGDAPATHPEPDAMSSNSIRERILDTIKEGGGSVPSRVLNEALDDLTAAHRRLQVQQLVNERAIVASGTTVDRAYSLPGVKPKPVGKKAAKQAKTKVKSAPTLAAKPESDTGAPETPAAAPKKDPWAFATAAPCQGATLNAGHLKRLLVLILRADVPLTQDDRYALAAVAEVA